jgi:hypothetical protein
MGGTSFKRLMDFETASQSPPPYQTLGKLQHVLIWFTPLHNIGTVSCPVQPDPRSLPSKRAESSAPLWTHPQTCLGSFGE